MKCNKCGNEISNESEFCSYCGNKTEKEEKKTIKLSLKKIIMIEIIVILGIAVVAGICISIWTRPQISKEETTQNIQTSSSQESIEIKEKIIPDNEKVVVTFINDNGSRSYEERQIANREKLLDYNYKNLSKIKTDMAIHNLGNVYELSSSLFYFEGEYTNGTKFSDYGSIGFANALKVVGKNYNFRTVSTIWNDYNNIHNNYSVIYENSKNVKPQDINNFRGNNYITLMKKYSNSTYGSNVSNLRIGFIDGNKNEWITEYSNKIEQENNNLENNNLTQNNNTYSNNSYESYKEEQYLPPEISIQTYKRDETDNNSLIFNYYVKGQDNEEKTITIKNNGKVITNKKIYTTYNYWSGDETINLEEGLNKIEVIVSNSKGMTDTDTYEIKLEYKKPNVSINNALVATDDKMFELSYGISDEYDTELTVTIKNNGRIITNKKVSTNGVYWKHETIELEKGINKIEVIVTNSKGKTNSAQHEIEY